MALSHEYDALSLLESGSSVLSLNNPLLIVAIAKEKELYPLAWISLVPLEAEVASKRQ